MLTESTGSVKTIDGTIFDIYNLEDQVHVWLTTPDGPKHFLDYYQPYIFADGPIDIVKRLVDRLNHLGAISGEPEWTVRKHFYKNAERTVLKIQIAKPSVLRIITRKLYAFYGKLDLYHSDIEIPTGYMFAKNIFPLCRVQIQFQSYPEGSIIRKIKPLDHITDLEYSLPKFKLLSMYLEKSPRLGLRGNTLIFELDNKEIVHVKATDEIHFLNQLHSILASEDPDIILTATGDQVLFPEIFAMAQKYNQPLLVDRHGHHSLRKIIRKGKSFMSYGSWIFRAAAYPLFGRLHIDSQNSFVFKETQLQGVFELARLSRTPIQRMARQSTGGALTTIETSVAIKKHYLIPWQKSSVEKPRTA